MKVAKPSRHGAGKRPSNGFSPTWIIAVLIDCLSATRDRSHRSREICALSTPSSPVKSAGELAFGLFPEHRLHKARD